MTRPTCVHIDLDALRHNYHFARQVHGGRALAVMKANAYGHGAVTCALDLQDIADGYAVAFMDEAIELREHGIHKPIVVLEGVFDAKEMEVALEKQLSIVIHQQEQVDLLEGLNKKISTQDLQHSGHRKKRNITGSHDCKNANQIDVWLKVDTGMHRLGFHPGEVVAVHQRLRSNTRVRSVILMTHFSRADEIDSAFTHQQIHCFDGVTSNIGDGASLCNSAGIAAWPKARRNWGRAGLVMYGADPMLSAAMTHHGSLISDVHTGIVHQKNNKMIGTVNHVVSLQHPEITPVMTLMSKVIAVRSVPAGEPIGYGEGYVTRRPTRIGVVAIGYGDGYPRHAPAGTPVLVNNQLACVIGRVCMDMLMIDLTDVPGAGIGSDVELWGKNLNVCRIAEHVGTVAHALLTGVMRVRRCHGDSRKAKANTPGTDLSLSS